MLLFQGAGARIPQQETEPLAGAVWPLWTGYDPSPYWQFRGNFAENLVSMSAPETIKRLSPAVEIRGIPAVGPGSSALAIRASGNSVQVVLSSLDNG